MKQAKAINESAPAAFPRLLYHFCRLQLPALAIDLPVLERHLERTYQVANAKTEMVWAKYLADLHPFDWYLVIGCIEKDRHAWDALFACKASRRDCLLIDALRARAARLYPRDDERQESAVTEFWSQLIASESGQAKPILARYDGLRPLVPWLIRVFQNQHISELRKHSGHHSLPDEDLSVPTQDDTPAHWQEAFRQAARESLESLSDQEIIILGLRIRYRLSQREVAQWLGVHEGTISRQTTQLRDRCLEHIQSALVEVGWTGDNLSDYVLREMGSVLLDAPRLSANYLAKLLSSRGRKLPKESE